MIEFPILSQLQDFFIYKYPIHEWFPDVFWTTNSSTEPGGHRIIGDEDFKEHGTISQGISGDLRANISDISDISGDGAKSISDISRKSAVVHLTTLETFISLSSSKPALR